MFTKSVDSIVAQFTKMIADLDKTIDHNNKRVKQYSDIIVQTSMFRAESEAEVARAHNIKSKITALIN